jgi:hypothetical protein
MYIEDRLFSETSGEVKYYSVVLSEEEYALFSEFQKEFGKVKRANKALKKAYEIKSGKEALRKHAKKYGWDEGSVAEAMKNQPDIINRGRKAMKSVLPNSESGKTISETYKDYNIHDKINLKDSLVSSKDTRLRIQHEGKELEKRRKNNLPGVEFKQLGNSRKLIKKSKIDQRSKENLLHDYDHGKVDSRGDLLSGRDMGYGNREWNVFRAASGHGYRKTW